MADFEHKNKVELVGELSKQADVSTTKKGTKVIRFGICLLYTSPSPRDRTRSRMPSSA